ncbi:MAG: T9SS type A sorting domain-containing protein [Flavobacteriales bacterium]
MHMIADQDTLINGQVYKRIDLIAENGWVPWHHRKYVRSSPDGKGYMYLTMLGAEFVTGDIQVTVGDTMHDVLILDETQTCESVIYDIGGVAYALADVVVQQIDTLSSAAVTVIRHWVWPLCSGAYEPLFYQRGIGTQHGPVLLLTYGFTDLRLHHASVGDTCYYNIGSDPPGLPGGGACCIVLDTDVSSVTDGRWLLYPNPSRGLFRLEGSSSWPVIVLHMHGREVLRLPPYSREIDLTGHPPGVYIAVFRVGDTRQVQRLVVVRE